MPLIVASNPFRRSVRPPILFFRLLFSQLMTHIQSRMASSQSPGFAEGKIDFIHQCETHQTYYKRFDDLDNGTRNPLVVLHVVS